MSDIFSIPRGTCKTMAFELFMDGQPFTMGSADYLVLTVKEKASESSPALLTKQGTAGKNEIELHAEDTMLSVGSYSADVRLYHNNCVYEVWGTGGTRETNLRNFEITAGVGV